MGNKQSASSSSGDPETPRHTPRNTANALNTTNMTSFFAEKQTRTTEDEGRRTEYQLGAGEVLDEFAKLPDEDG